MIGSMRLKLWVGTSEGDDLDLFVVLRKLDPSGREVYFSGFKGYERDSLAKGCLELRIGSSSVAQHRTASMAQPYTDSESAFGRHRAGRNRNLAVCDALRGWINPAVDNPRSRCS